MKKFILNLMTIISWFVEVFMWFALVIWVLLMGALVFFLTKEPDVIREFAKEPNLRQFSSQFWQILPFFMLVGFIAVIF